MKKIILFVLLGIGTHTIHAQKIRFALQAGVAIPLGDLAKDNIHPENGGFAKSGFDMKFVGERIFENNFVAGMNLGFSMFGIDQDALKSFINPGNPELVKAETQAFQNINLQFRGGYDWNINDGGFHVIPFVDAGFGIFYSAYYAIQVDGGKTYLRSGNSGAALLISPGLDITFQVNDFVGIKIYGNYQFADYRVEEEFKELGGTPTIIYNETKNYKYNSACIGIGANVIL